jgi:hypothetical protein
MWLAPVTEDGPLALGARPNESTLHAHIFSATLSGAANFQRFRSPDSIVHVSGSQRVGDFMQDGVSNLVVWTLRHVMNGEFNTFVVTLANTEAAFVRVDACSPAAIDESVLTHQIVHESNACALVHR